MKRLFALIFVFVLLLTLAACNVNNGSPDETHKKETTSDEVTVNEQNLFKYKSNLLRKHVYAYENPDIFVEYLDNNLNYVRTTNDQILIRTEIKDENASNSNKTQYKWDVFFDYSNINDLQEAFILPGGSQPDRPAYYDTDGVLHVKVDDIWFICPEITGRPYVAAGYNNRNPLIGEVDRYYLTINTYEESKPSNTYRYDELEGLISHGTDFIQDINTEQIFDHLDFAIADYYYYDWNTHMYGTTEAYVANGTFYVQESSYEVKSIGSAEDFVTDWSEMYILCKKDNGTTLWYYDQEMKLPDGKTPAQIIDAASDGDTSVVFFDDETVYLYFHIWDGTTFSTTGPIYVEELTSLNRDGKIKDLGAGFSVFFILDDNVTYSLDMRELSKMKQIATQP